MFNFAYNVNLREVWNALNVRKVFFYLQISRGAIAFVETATSATSDNSAMMAIRSIQMVALPVAKFNKILSVRLSH